MLSAWHDIRNVIWQARVHVEQNKGQVQMYVLTFILLDMEHLLYAQCISLSSSQQSDGLSGQ